MAGELARRGCIVTMHDSTEHTRKRAIESLRAFLHEHAREGNLRYADIEVILSRCTLVRTLQEAVANAQVSPRAARGNRCTAARKRAERVPELRPPPNDRQAIYHTPAQYIAVFSSTAQMIFEAVPENLEIKCGLFVQVADCIDRTPLPLLCSNTLNLEIAQIAKPLPAVLKPRLIGCRFLHPVPPCPCPCPCLCPCPPGPPVPACSPTDVRCALYPSPPSCTRCRPYLVRPCRGHNPRVAS